jgi:hypothetical protein
LQQISLWHIPSYDYGILVSLTKHGSYIFVLTKRAVPITTAHQNATYKTGPKDANDRSE